jgi:hypothetical protein
MAAILKSLGDFLDNISGVPGSIGVSAVQQSNVRVVCSAGKISGKYLVTHIPHSRTCSISLSLPLS